MVNVFKLLPLGDWLWAGLAASIVGYHVVTLERAKSETRAAVSQEWVAKVDEAERKSAEDRAAIQAKLDFASQQREQIETAVAAYKRILAQPVKPAGASVPASCKADPARVAWADSTR